MRFFTSDIRRNIIKIVCLTIGLAMGFLLVAKIYFEQTYDNFFPNVDRIYRLSESVTQNGEYREYMQTPGAIAPGLKRYAPQVEVATRCTYLLGENDMRTDDGRVFTADGVWLADSSFFDVFQTRIIAGNPHEALAEAAVCMIPRSLADKIGGDVVGQRLCALSFSEDYKVTVGGVYEDFPLNSTIYNVIYLSLPSIGSFSYDGRENWVGNDRYRSYVRLVDGATPEELKPNIMKMLKDNVDNEFIETFAFRIGLKPLVGIYTSQESVRTMTWMLSLLAVILLMSAGLNYLLIVIGQMGHRSKEMAVRKCYGTGNGRIFGRVMGESLFFLLVSIGLAVLLVFCFADLCRNLLGYTPQELFSTGKVWLVEGAVCVGLLLITGAVPAWLYCRTPVASAFRSNVRSRRGWKLALLAVQFFASGMLMCLLVLVGRQYYMMSRLDMGFDYEDIGYVSLSGVPGESRSALVSELKSLGCVEGAAASYHNFLYTASGNNVWVGDDYGNNINVADFYIANPDIFDVMGIEFVQGGTFDMTADSVGRQVVVEERFADVLKKLTGEADGNLIGKTFNITEHTHPEGGNDYIICGVIENMRRGGFDEESADMRSAVIFPTRYISDNLFVRFNRLTADNLRQAQEVISRVYPTRDIYITPYKTQVEQLTADVRRFGTSVIIAGIAIVVIALIGLVGYTADEVQRRAREIAIRKVTGTPASRIVRLFCIDILKVALPSMLAGGAVAVVAGREWLSQYTEQVSLSPLSMVLCIILLLVLLISVVVFNSLNVARSNPVDHLRSE
ncbi:MAG: ABC transporter permease [Muribaculaceae bacterium]|nr:ABC transporter permease [Muribaculaceae bacterium]